MKLSVAAASMLAVVGASAATLTADGVSNIIRIEDQRVADISYRLAVGGVARCQPPASTLGLVLQHESQFALADRPKAVSAYGLDRGPGILAVVSGGPAASAGLQAGDVILDIDGIAIPSESALDQPFDQAVARARADLIDGLLDKASTGRATTLAVWRTGVRRVIGVTPVAACPSRVHLARSHQLNAYADGTHVFLTTRLLDLARTDDELAFVIAHEMAHNILHHAAALRSARTGDGGGGGLLGRKGLTRRTEREADLLGTDILLDSGYSAEGAASLLALIDHGLTGPAFLSNHDGLRTRIAAIRARAAARRTGLQ